jgi:hypothetical protein
MWVTGVGDLFGSSPMLIVFLFAGKRPRRILAVLRKI